MILLFSLSLTAGIITALISREGKVRESENTERKRK